jgi:adenine-specific DNA methylase
MRFENNFKILEIIKKNVDLKQYSGFGGLYKTMSNEDHKKLKDLLGETSYNQIMASSKTAYYTPKPIIDFIYKALNKLGFEYGRILEPACGHGTFIFNMPDEMRINSSIHACELDKISVQLARNICPYANIENSSFERYQENNFDLIVGNPPYSNSVIRDCDKELDDYVIHHYFMAKSIKLLKDGGILAFVVPTYCFDNLKGHARNLLSKYSRLIAAFRLPDNMFDNAKVTVDIVFLQKTNDTSIGHDFLMTKDIKVNNKTYPMNEYYHKHPNHILGELGTALVYKERIALTVSSALSRNDIFIKLNEKLDSLKPIYKPKSQDNIIKQIKDMKDKIINQSTSNALFAKLKNLEVKKLQTIEQEYIEICSQIQDCLKSIKQ